MPAYTNLDSSSTTALMPSQRTYIHTGIGGAGNYKPTSTIQMHIKQAKPILKTTGTFLTGIGGSGNSRRYEQRASVSQEEHIARKQLIRDNAPLAYHHGVGGAGNRAGAAFNGSRSSRDSSRGISSSSSSESLVGAERVKEKLVSYMKL